MKKIMLLAIGMLMFSGCGDSAANKDTATDRATDQTTDDEVAEQVSAVTTEHAEAMKTFRKWYASASDEEKQNDFESQYPKADEYGEKLFKIAKENPQAPSAVDALVWVASNARGTDIAKDAVAILLDKHTNNDAIAAVVPMMAYEVGEQVEKQLRGLASDATNERVKGTATLTLANYLKRVPEMKETVAGNPQMAEYFSDHLTYIEGFEPKEGEVVQLYSTVIDKYSQVSSRGGTLGESASAALFEMQRLQVGMEAPDIEGADLDGVDFKLTDYRGKVVLLDFWGNW